MQFTFRSFIHISLASFLALTLLIPQVQAIGISPPIIQATDVLRNSSQSYSVTLLVQNPAPNDLYFSAESRGEYGHYLKGPSELIIPKGKTSALYEFELEPIEAAVGTYNLELAFTEKQKAIDSSGEEGGAKVVVLQGAILVISMSVSGEEKISYEITRAQFEDTEPRIPLIGIYTVKNTGNVEWKPDRIEVEAYEIEDPENTEIYEVKSDAIALIKPGKTVDAKLSLPHKLVEGRYRAKVRFYYKGEMVQELEASPFNVFQVGTLDQAGELVEVTTNKTAYNPGEQVVLRGLFKNTGDVTVEGQLETQVYKNGEFINLEVSRTQSVDRRQESTFEQFIKLTEPGEYTFEVAATYGTRKTSPHKVTVTVGSSALGAVGNMYITITLLSLFVIGVIIFLILFARHRKKKEEQGVTLPLQGGQIVAPLVVTPAPAASLVASVTSAAPVEEKAPVAAQVIPVATPAASETQAIVTPASTQEVEPLVILTSAAPVVVTPVVAVPPVEQQLEPIPAVTSPVVAVVSPVSLQESEQVTVAPSPEEAVAIAQTPDEVTPPQITFPL